MKSPYGIFTIETHPPQSSNQPSHRSQTNDKNLDVSKAFTEYIKNIQHQNSQRANSTFLNDVISIIYKYVSRLETNEKFYASPPHTSQHAIVRR